MKNNEEKNVTSHNTSENLKEEFEKTGKIHIEKDQDGEKVIIDVDKDSKTVNINKSADGTNVKVGITGVKVNDKDGKSIVNIPFIPIFIFAFCVLGGLLFFIYKIAELIIGAFK